jgi:hypothetical protein
MPLELGLDLGARTFEHELPQICIAAALDFNDLDFNDFLYFANQWIKMNA